jgi:hypothetical protein
MSFTYWTFQVALATNMAVPNSDPNDPAFNWIVNTLIDQAEQRCYRDLDLLNATSTQTTVLSAGVSTLDFSTLNPSLIILEDVNLILPWWTTNPEWGERVPVYSVSKEWLRMTYGLSATQGPPAYYALSDDHAILFGPFHDQPYTAELIGKFRPTPLYYAWPNDGSQVTVLTQLLPDLFLAAAMVAATGYQHNFGAQSDDPRSAMSWEQSYQALLGPAKDEEMRKKYHGWMSMTAERAAPTGPP